MRDAAIAWAGWLEQTPPALFVRESAWAYPALEIVHVLGVIALVGSAMLWDLRLFGGSSHLPARHLEKYLLPWARRGFALALLSGALLFASGATSLVESGPLQLKVGLIAVAAFNAAVFHRGVFRSAKTWDTGTSPPPGARAAALVSLATWTGVIVCAQLIPYR